MDSEVEDAVDDTIDLNCPETRTKHSTQIVKGKQTEKYVASEVNDILSFKKLIPRSYRSLQFLTQGT